MPQFQAFYITENADKTFSQNVVERKIEDLPAGEVLIKVQYSSLNYKDALSSTGNRGVTRHYPHTPGIDATGIVEESTSPDFQKGDSHGERWPAPLFPRLVQALQALLHGIACNDARRRLS